MVKERTDQELLQLLRSARAEGVRHLEVRRDGTIVADIDPLPPPAPQDPKKATPEEERKAYEEHIAFSGDG